MHDSAGEVIVDSHLAEGESRRYSELAERSPILRELLDSIARSWAFERREPIVQRLTNTSLDEAGVRVDLIYELYSRSTRDRSRLNLQFFFAGNDQQFIAFRSTTKDIPNENGDVVKVRRIQSIFKEGSRGMEEHPWNGGGILETRPYDQDLRERILDLRRSD